VLGTNRRREEVVERLIRRGQRPQKLIITAQNFSGAAGRALLERADALAIPLARLPRLTDFRTRPPAPRAHHRADRLEDLLDAHSGAPIATAWPADFGRRRSRDRRRGDDRRELARQIATFAAGACSCCSTMRSSPLHDRCELRERFPRAGQLPLCAIARVPPGR